MVKYYGFKPVQAHGAIEIKPPIVWSKGMLNALFLSALFTNNNRLIKRVNEPRKMV